MFDNREMAEGEKLDISKVSKYSENLKLVIIRGYKSKTYDSSSFSCCRQGEIPQTVRQTATKFPQNAR